MTEGKSQPWLAFQVGCTYIGTVVGAGFASGQEIFQFFGRYGNVGYLAIVVAVVLFAILGYRVMFLGHRLKATSYRELNLFLFGKTLGPVFDFVLVLMLFGVTVAMLAGAGELFKERLQISFQIGAIFTLIVTYVTIARGMKGILEANTVIVPTMVSFVLYAAYHVLHAKGFGPIWKAGGVLATPRPILAVISGVVYAAFNLGLAAGVLLPLGASVTQEKTLRTGALIGAGGLGSMLIAVMLSLYGHYPKAMEFAVPMAYIATQIGPIIQWIFIFVLWGEIYSTLVGNVFAVGAQFGATSQRQINVMTVCILVVAYLCSQIGFETMVTYVYGVFGWISTAIVMALIWPREKLSRP